MALRARRVFFLLLLAIGVQIRGTECKKKGAKITTMHFYMRDNVDPNNRTVVNVAGPKNNLTAFGSVAVLDDRLTEGPALESKTVGRARGIYIADSLSNFSLLFVLTACFDNGTINFQGQDPLADPVRELVVVGGTGVFRFCRGYAEIRTQEIIGFTAVLDFRVFLKLDED